MDNNNCSCCANSNDSCGTYSGFSILKATTNTYDTIERSTGDSRKIRIGNDINLDVTIQELNGMVVINIKAIKCFIINTTPMMMDQRGNAYEIHRCGLPQYHCLPSHCGDFCGWKNHGVGDYYGFGMYPCAHKNWHCNLHPHYDYFYRNPYGRYQLKCVAPEHKPFEFIAPVKALEARNKVRVYFPASAQLLCGLYSMTFVIDLYEPGYHCNNLRTITVDYNNVFELVPNMEGASGNIIVDIDKQVGLNVVDNLLWGGSTNTTTSPTAMQSLEIQGPAELRVGEIGKYIALQDPKTNQIEWSLLDGGHAQLAAAESDYAILYANKISNTVDGYNTTILQIKSTDGTGLSDSLPVKIHNYAVDIDWGIYGGKPGEDIIVNIEPGKSITAPIYVTQEDGTRLSYCERGPKCQTIPVGLATIDPNYGDGISIASGEIKSGEKCSWTYDDTDNNTQDTTDDYSDTMLSGSCCQENLLTITNTNVTGESKECRVILTSLMKDKDGEFITKIIRINCKGGGTQPTPGPGEEDKDVYIESGTYHDNVITAYYNDSTMNPLTINVEDMFDVQNVDYWYNPNSVA